MIRADAAGTRRLSLITAQNGAQCVVGGSSYDTTTGSYSDLVPTCTTISSSTTTSIDTAPSGNCINDYDFVNIKNTFAGSHTMTLQLTSGSGGPFPLKTFTLLQDESMNYAHGTGFQFFDANGNLKESLAAATNWGVTGNLTVGGNTTLGDAAADSLTINAGVFSWPNKPCFLAFNSTTRSNVTGAGTTVTVPFDTEVFDQGNNFASNTFTAPVTGKYRLSYAVRVADLAVAMTGKVYTLVTSNASYPITLDDVPAGAGEAFSGNFSMVVDMDAGDTATVSVRVSGGVGDNADITGDATTRFTCFGGEQVA